MRNFIRFAGWAWLSVLLVGTCEAGAPRRYSTGVVGTFGQNSAGATRPAPRHLHRPSMGNSLGGGMTSTGVNANSLGISSASTGIPSAGSMTGTSGTGITGTANHHSARNHRFQHSSQSQGFSGSHTKVRSKLITPNSRY